MFLGILDPCHSASPEVAFGRASLRGAKYRRTSLVKAMMYGTSPSSPIGFLAKEPDSTIALKAVC